MLTLKKTHNKYFLPFTKNVNNNFSRRVKHHHDNLTSIIIMRTNVLGDFIDKFNTDIAIVESNSDDYYDEYECKYVAMFRAGLIIVLLIFMFIDWDGDNEKEILLDNLNNNTKKNYLRTHL